jgi:hypothetical protein
MGHSSLDQTVCVLAAVSIVERMSYTCLSVLSLRFQSLFREESDTDLIVWNLQLSDEDMLILMVPVIFGMIWLISF